MIREYKENSDELFQFCDEEKYLLRGGSDDQVKIQSPRQTRKNACTIFK